MFPYLIILQLDNFETFHKRGRTRRDDDGVFGVLRYGEDDDTIKPFL